MSESAPNKGNTGKDVRNKSVRVTQLESETFEKSDRGAVDDLDKEIKHFKLSL